MKRHKTDLEVVRAQESLKLWRESLKICVDKGWVKATSIATRKVQHGSKIAVSPVWKGEAFEAAHKSSRKLCMRYETGLIATLQTNLSAEQTSRRISWPKPRRAMLKKTVLSDTSISLWPTVQTLRFFDLLLASKKNCLTNLYRPGILAGGLILTGRGSVI